VPSIAFSSTGGAYRHHLRDDTIHWVSPAKLNQIVSLVTQIVQSVQDKPLGWMREPAKPGD
jgi:hypothetical protein